MKKGLISILLPFKNSELYFKDCLDSIIDQSEDQWELIAINDHSEDKSMAIVQDYSYRDGRIKLLENTGKGIIDALNTAYSNSQGEFIHRMDSDDIMPKRKLEVLKNLLHKKGKGYVSTGMVKYFSEDDISDGYKKYQSWLNDINLKGIQWENIYKECVIASPAWMIYRNDFENCGAFRSELFPEDYDLVFRMHKSALKVISSPETIHLWREHKARTSRNNKHYQQKAFFNLKVHHFLKNEIRNENLIVFASGLKAKILGQILLEHKVQFEIISQNKEKSKLDIKKEIDELLKDRTNSKYIVAIESKDAKMQLKSLFSDFNKKENVDYFNFS
ncbi:glycosyltransferase family 2 protein [Hyphobacterium sp. CCMP332]|nr:glycosyltransferase family 2 protein [Hyphobacterium sp. CCMP332]